ncbi:MAG: hypothetical protein M1421_01635 [Candidatus Eremiobacteraeota bacterium]|jgi:hypothetical protein|nr:hypothetical protein [Candidatus Eremiobacteraeota bacterium]
MELLDSNQLRTLIEQVALQVLNKTQPEPVTFKGKVLLFSDIPDWSPGSLPSDKILWKPEITFQARDLDGIEIIHLSAANLSKLVHLIWDTPFLEAIGQVLLEGGKVKVTDPKWKNKTFWKNKSKIFFEALSELIEKAKSYGIEFEIYEPSKEAVTVQKVVTYEDIMKFLNNGIRSLILPKGTIITPLAAELAKDRGIILHSSQ